MRIRNCLCMFNGLGGESTMRRKIAVLCCVVGRKPGFIYFLALPFSIVEVVFQ